MPERVEDREHVGRQVLLLVTVARARRDQPKPRRSIASTRWRSASAGIRMPPLVPVLRPAVQAEDDVVAGARFGDVEVEPARLDPAVA